MIASFPRRLFSAVFQAAVVLFEHLPPLIAAAVLLAAVAAVVTVTVAVPWHAARLAVRVWRWIQRRAADRKALAELNREYAALCKSHRAETTATPPRVCFALKRRRMPSMRISRRRVRHTTSSSDRRH